MWAKKLGLVLAGVAVLSMSPLQLVNSAHAARGDRMHPERHKPLDRKKVIENIREDHPEIIQMLQNLRDMQNEARQLAREYSKQTSAQQKREIENRLRFIIEDILRHQFTITERTLDYLAERQEQLRQRHQKNIERFDDIVEKRFREFLRFQ